jgi:putative DNA primase/helicase
MTETPNAAAADAADLVAAALKDVPELVVHAADRPATVFALRDVLASADNLFDRGGMPVMLLDPADGSPPVARRMTFNNVIVEAHQHCRPVRIDEKGVPIPITLPDSVAKMYLDLGKWKLKPLAGISTAPLLGSDGSILDRAGYDPKLQLWCKPVENLALPDWPSRAAAEAALLRLRKAFRTFPFRDAPTVTEDRRLRVVDTTKPPCGSESSLLTGLLTACCRPSLWLAPGMLVRAPDISGSGTGKGLLVRAVSAVAFGIMLRAFGRGHDRQELDKESSPT